MQIQTPNGSRRKCLMNFCKAPPYPGDYCFVRLGGCAWYAKSNIGFPKFVRAFVRNADGSWTCRQRAHLVGPYGPFTTEPGVTYGAGEVWNGYEIAHWLDDWHEHNEMPIGVEFL